MAAMEAAAVAAGQDQQQQPTKVVERLNPALQQQLNLEYVKTRAISLFKAISRILEDLDALARVNATPKWYQHAISIFRRNSTLFFLFFLVIDRFGVLIM